MAWNWIDLSQPFYEGMPHAAAVADPTITTIRDYPHMTEYTFVSHLGTHVDAPLHFISGGATIDQLPLDHFAGGGVIVNISKTRNTAITAKDLSDAVPAIKPGDIVLIYTGWGEKFGTEEYYYYPYLDNDAARWLVEQKVKMVGVDTPSPDMPHRLRRPDFDFPIHHILLGNGVLVIEHLRLGAAAGHRAQVMALPMKIQGCDGAPARVVALLED